MNLKQLARHFFGKLQALRGKGNRNGRLNVVANGISATEMASLHERAAFFFPDVKSPNIVVHDTFSSGIFLDAAPILIWGVEPPQSLPAKLHGGVFDVDWRHNPNEGWNWIDAANWSHRHTPDITAAKQRFLLLRKRLTSLGLDRAYVFGTGPSLGRAGERDWSDGIRIVCNTIVRDPDLWRHISPHLIVAGDGIYHFGFTEFALAFRRDLRLRLEQNPEVPFMYPSQFDLVVRREMGHLPNQLIPIPIGTHTTFHARFDERFELPALGNVLNLLLLPVGCNFARYVGLWGFDGRAPKDQLFWANSSKQSYSELLPTLQLAHPAFFDHNVPKEDPEKYLRSVHGDVLEHGLAQAESQGWTFEMLHTSWTPTLAKRAAPQVVAWG